MESSIDKEIKKVREDYILALFKFKKQFEKKKEEDDRAAAYKELVKLIK